VYDKAGKESHVGSEAAAQKAVCPAGSGSTRQCRITYAGHLDWSVWSYPSLLIVSFFDPGIHQQLKRKHSHVIGQSTILRAPDIGNEVHDKSLFSNLLWFQFLVVFLFPIPVRSHNSSQELNYEQASKQEFRW